jgi:RHS repeat-associated protein
VSVDGTSIFAETRTYDNVGNVLNVNTTLPTTAGASQTDNQAFCYDDQNRLVWAGNTGTPTGGDHCGVAPAGTTITPYQESYSYDALGRLITGPSGTTTYDDPSHVHAVTGIATVPGQYASYDAMGDMTCRNVDPTTAHSCDASQTGATMTYDNEGNLATWTAPSGTTASDASQTGATMTYDNEGNLATWTAPSGTTASDAFLYDNDGNRVLQRASSTTNGTTNVTDTIDFDGYTETTITNGQAVTTKYYSAAGQTVAQNDGTNWDYLVPDDLGSASLALTGSGAVQAVQLYDPFGTERYSDGSMPTPRNFAGMLLDSQTGLLYDNARYYDPVSGQFTTPDSVEGNGEGMNPYVYVLGNPGQSHLNNLIKRKEKARR